MNYTSMSRIGYLAVFILILFFTTASFADEPVPGSVTGYPDTRLSDFIVNTTDQPFRYRLGEHRMKVDGFKLSSSVYLGEARLDNGRQWALLLDTGRIVYAVNENHFSLAFRF